MSVDPEHLKKMQTLARQVQKHLPEFYLAGGTSLMFRCQHRVSTDLDFFCQREFSHAVYGSRLRKAFPVNGESRGTDNVDFLIEGVKVSLVFFPFTNEAPLDKVAGVSMVSEIDLALNKIYVAGRRVDVKDPVDFAVLQERNSWSVDYLKRLFETKFPDQSFEIFLGAMLSTEDYPKLPPETKDVLAKFRLLVDRGRDTAELS